MGAWDVSVECEERVQGRLDTTRMNCEATFAHNSILYLDTRSRGYGRYTVHYGTTEWYLSFSFEMILCGSLELFVDSSLAQ